MKARIRRRLTGAVDAVVRRESPIAGIFSTIGNMALFEDGLSPGFLPIQFDSSEITTHVSQSQQAVRGSYAPGRTAHFAFCLAPEHELHP